MIHLTIAAGSWWAPTLDEPLTLNNVNVKGPYSLMRLASIVVVETQLGVLPTIKDRRGDTTYQELTRVYFDGKTLIAIGDPYFTRVPYNDMRCIKLMQQSIAEWSEVKQDAARRLKESTPNPQTFPTDTDFSKMKIPVECEVSKSWDDIEEISREEAFMYLSKKVRPSPVFVQQKNKCRHFIPIYITKLVMPEGQRPARIFWDRNHPEWHTSGAILKRQWEKIANDKISELQRTELSLPRCPVHHNDTMTEKAPGLSTALVKIKGEGWVAHMWWVCEVCDSK